MLHLVAGPMFADKTRTLIDACRVAAKTHGPEAVVAIVPSSDTRSRGQLRSHAGEVCPAYAVSTLDELRSVVYPRPNLKLVAVDEVQLFDAEIARELRLLAGRVAEVWAAGLLHDFRGAPFENTVETLLVADHVLHKTARCVECDQPAAFTHRKGGSVVRVVVGGAEAYEPRCRRHWDEVVADPWRP